MVESLPSAEMLRLILEEVKEIKKDFRDHIADENIEFEKIREQLHRHSLDQALTRQRLTLVSAGIAIAVSGAFTYFMNVFGFHMDP